jgi:hypothetical protein
MRWAAGLVFLLGCGPKDDGTYRNPQFHFSFSRPQGWQAVVPASDYAKEVVKQYGDRLLDTTRIALLSPASGRTYTAAVFIKLDASERLLPVIGVAHNPVGLPQVGDEELRKSIDMLDRKIAATPGFSGCQFERRDLVDVDGRKAVRQRYATNYQSRSPNGADVTEFQLRSEETMVAAPDQTHFVSLVCDAKGWDAHLPVYAQVIATFRRLP